MIEGGKNIRDKLGVDAKISFVSGNFDIIHPGHLRLLNFAAEAADFLVVGLYNDDSGENFFPALARKSALESIEIVSYVVILDTPIDQFISELRPNVVVKGLEFQNSFNIEEKLLQQYGGTLLFCSGEISKSTKELLLWDVSNKKTIKFLKPQNYIDRHSIKLKSITDYSRNFTKLKVLVIGDSIIDEYISCDAIGMSKEDPALVVSPSSTKYYLGGASIVASHAAGLGAQVYFFTVTGMDQFADMLTDKTAKYGIKHKVFRDESRPTSIKTRYRVGNKSLFRVNNIKSHDISRDLEKRILDEVIYQCSNIDLLVFSDFSYGMLTDYLVNNITNFCSEKGIKIVADSQSSSQVGDITRYKNTLLVKPTEYEARTALRDYKSGLVVLANQLVKVSNPENILLTMAGEGVFIYSSSNKFNGHTTDQLPALNSFPVDVSGAGDCMFITSALALASGASIWEAAYLGSVAAAFQVSKTGNNPIEINELLSEVKV